MPNNEFIRLTTREWDALRETVEHTSNAVERLEREVLVFKAKASVWMLVLGTMGSIIGFVASHVLGKIWP